jgi:hypothetical protein
MALPTQTNARLESATTRPIITRNTTRFAVCVAIVSFPSVLAFSIKVRNE